MSSSITRPSISHHAYKGQAITELALIAPVLVIMLLGIVEGAGAYGAKLDLQAATGHGARIGALLGNGGATVFTCPNTSSGTITDTVDMAIVQAISSTKGIDVSKVAKIQVFKAGVSGSPVISGTSALLNEYTAPFITSSGPITRLVASQYNWPSCTRQSSEPADSLGVRVFYNYRPTTPLFGQTTLQMHDQTVERINPTKNDNPCPVPNAPTDLSAHWLAPQPSATDQITFTAGSDATSYKVYANLAGSGASSNSTPLETFTASPGTVSRTETHPGPAGAQVTYQVVGHNYCGDGDMSDPALNMQYAAAITPTIITATTSSNATPPTDYIAWRAVPDAASYTITQTASTGGSTTTTVTAPTTSTTMSDPYGISSSPVTVTYQVAATSLTTVSGPFTTTVITPTLPPAPSTSLVGWWAFDDTYPTTTTDSAPGNLHPATLNSGATRSSIAPSSAFTTSLNLNATSAISAYASAAVGTGLPTAGASQTITWWMKGVGSATNTTYTALSMINADAATPNNCSGLVIGYKNSTVYVWPYVKTSSTTCGPNTGSPLVTAPVPTSNWNYYAFTYDNTAPYTRSLYVNNNAPIASTGLWSVGSSPAPTRLDFGRWMQVQSPTTLTDRDYFAGYIDDVHIYSRPLAQPEVSTLYYEP